MLLEKKQRFWRKAAAQEARRVQKEKEALRIAMLGQKRIPSREGGVEIVVEELAVRLVQMGYSVTCYNRSGRYTNRYKYDRQESGRYKGVRLISVPTLNRKGLAAVTSSIFAAVRAAFGSYDVVHFHAEGPCVMLWLPKICGKHCVATIHGLDWQRAKWGGFASRYIHLGEKIAVRYADEVIVLNKKSQEYFKKEYDRETVFIPNGVERPEVKDAVMIKEKWGLEKDSYILFLGRLVPEKGIDCLIEAFQKVKTDRKLVIAGGSSDTDRYQKELHKMSKGDKRILFTGFVQGRIQEELYSNAYLYALPSNLEGMPLSLLEAMSYGNCCLVSDISECTEVVENKAAVFRKSDSEDLREKLQLLCNRRDIVEQYRNGVAEFVCQKYAWEDVVEKTLELY